jgi:sterol desaturase/sphingolipid hydroxylase (fatty acid hydroxylase superfamily)
MFNFILVTIFSLFVLCVLICYITTHKNFEVRNIDYNYLLSISTTYVSGIILVFILFFIKQDTFFGDRIIPDPIRIVLSLITSDTLYYWFHYLMHRIPYLKNNFHMHHHSHKNLIPTDVLDGSFFEKLIEITIVTIIPSFLFNLNILEISIIIFFVFILFLYIHSESEEKLLIPFFIDSEFHKNHHQIGGGNYSVFFRYWDAFMETTIKKDELLK